MPGSGSSPSLPFAIRPGTPEDALCVGVLAMQVFLDTYVTEGVTPPLAREAMRGHAPPELADHLAERGLRFLLAETPERALVGFAEVALASRCPVAGIDGPEVVRLYVQRPFKRQGIGVALVREAERVARGLGQRTLWLDAWAGNAPALAFYAATGWRDVGATLHVIEGTGYENRVLAKDTAAA